MSPRSNAPRDSNKAKSKGSKANALQSRVHRPSQPSQSKIVPVELQQLLLNVFKDAFSECFNSKLSDAIQQTKHHLFERDFESAFGKENLREAYAIRWSPSRALAYNHIITNLTSISTKLFSIPDVDAGNSDKSLVEQLQNILANSQISSADAENLEGKSKRIVCVGAGAGAEIVALGGYLNFMNRLASDAQKANPQNECRDESPSQLHLKVTALDIADWDSVVRKLQSSITLAPPLSQYASAEAKARNAPFIGIGTMDLDFIKQDVLSIASDAMPAIFADCALVTLMFTLNELYSSSMSATTTLLLSLTMLLSPGALLLVVDSPGSYSTVNFGKALDSGNQEAGKGYPMQWLLDHTLLESAAIGSSKNASAERQWEKLVSQDSEWFRLPIQLHYPIELEDMRYQVHLYRRL